METLIAVAVACMASFRQGSSHNLPETQIHTHADVLLPLPAAAECEDHRAEPATWHVQRVHPLGNTVQKK